MLLRWDAMTAQWPELPLPEPLDTFDTLHMCSQVVGKLCLALTAPLNHWWNVAFRLTPEGLATPLLHFDDRPFAVVFDLIEHQVRIDFSTGFKRSLPLEGRTVAEFYGAFMNELRSLGITTRIWPMPVEVPEPVRFEQDTARRTYDPAVAEAFLRALLEMEPVFMRFRSGFVGKCSPLHFFWGSFDLALTRFSGRRAPERPEADRMTREAYSHEVISHGFWPGGGAVRQPAFYAYAAPEPDGFRTATLRPDSVFYSPEFRIFILPYDAVRQAASPASVLTAFLESTYSTAADLARWDRAALEQPPARLTAQGTSR
jgi:hypothetical protein